MKFCRFNKKYSVMPWTVDTPFSFFKGESKRRITYGHVNYMSQISNNVTATNKQFFS